MKKKLLIFSFISFFLVIISAYAATSFKIDFSKVFSENSKTKKLQSTFNSEYIATSKKGVIEDEEAIREATKMITYYLLGPTNNTNETAENYINRKKKFNDMRYAPEIPKLADGSLDRDSQEYKDDSYTSWKIPNSFLLFQEFDIVYNQFGNVQIAENNGLIITMITLPNVKMSVSNKERPMEFDTIVTDLTIKYIFKKLDGVYKLYYVEGEYDDSDLEEYFNEQMKNEYNGTLSANIVYKSDLSELYDYSKLEKVSRSTVEKIYKDNLENIIILNTLYSNSIVHTATGFIISDSIAVTTWSYLDKSLRDGQAITIKDGNEKVLKLDGIISIDIENDLVLLKISGSNSKGVKIGDTSELVTNDPIISIGTKTSVSLSVQKGIVMTTKPTLTNLIPLKVEEAGGPVFNKDGEVVGMNSSQLVNVSFSKANSSVPIKELQTKLKNKKIEDVEYKTFTELKENYYVKYNNDNVVNKIKDKVWNKYKTIGDIEKNISLELIKASYKDGVMSLRYKNSVSTIFPNMQFASEFINKLKTDGYKEKINGDYKKIYTNKDYRVTIMSEFDYLIIVIAEI
jgi:Trypsin-like serine proteases, typically periplasmic, contain C-terminal PDZ domain